MKKIKSLFKRNYEGNRLVYDEVVPSSEWVLSGGGVATVKYDGTACMIRDGNLYKRYDRKLTKGAHKRHFDRKGNRITEGPMPESSFKAAPTNWLPCEEFPSGHTGHWPGWVPVGDGPEDKWHRDAQSYYEQVGAWPLPDYTYELVGPKVQGNPYLLSRHELWRHGGGPYIEGVNAPPRSFAGLQQWFEIQGYTDYNPKLMNWPIEGIVWHHPDGRMVKAKRRDFGFAWPIVAKKSI